MCIPALLYGTETWVIKKSQLARLERLQNLCLRVILKIFFATHFQVSNSTIRQKAESQSSVEQLIRTCRLRWFGRACQTRCSQPNPTRQKTTRRALSHMARITPLRFRAAPHHRTLARSCVKRENMEESKLQSNKCQISLARVFAQKKRRRSPVSKKVLKVLQKASLSDADTN